MDGSNDEDEAFARSLAAEADGIDMTYECAEMITKSGPIDKAIDAWATLLENGVNQYGEMSLECAQLYYRYGDALLRKSEESDEVFGDGIPENGEHKSGEEDDDDDDAEKKHNINNQEQDEREESDIAVAFEVLEVARVIWEREHKQLEVAKAYCRLGDLKKVNGNFGSAVHDYEACLQMRIKLLPVTDRRIADAHWCLATALDFHISEDSCQDKVLTKSKALEHYQKCANSLSERAQNLDTADPEWKELDSILQELKETISAAQDIQQQARQKQLNDYAALLAAKAKNHASTTDTAKTCSSSNVTTLQPKRKQQPYRLPAFEDASAASNDAKRIRMMPPDDPTNNPSSS
mmetsp:Transcript_22835/g.29592  ORF Transcript_22835/g.29592 Transcript_22835/m.29592 type:complete len:350 (-) Transcript_22835:194-1243(-)|eukprot:CAMPEP_0197312696 /NCGR_PEP_ID=MMETSP0891-20130614/22906_1 /TAXON_ID=44058 ORGANISM="Aureoumbra lagunensis, Strain CCMP1510" /NCGR_SAMPLE_ID=MMETSP0891 /ASSEMBLY_ACC=CAM_ASM_000534 /LENGTH=349 /DNA_ID=CAMNT_0042800061 /DNA_START=1316 /DNA_END=2365 /DNA_ORIENTATION=+